MQRIFSAKDSQRILSKEENRSGFALLDINPKKPQRTWADTGYHPEESLLKSPIQLSPRIIAKSTIPQTSKKFCNNWGNLLTTEKEITKSTTRAVQHSNSLDQDPLTTVTRRPVGQEKNIETGARLAIFREHWQGAPQGIFTTISRGYHWKWIDNKPPDLCLPNTTQHQMHLLPLIKEWEEKQVIVQVPYQPCFLSHLFTVPKPDGSLRPIIDLSNLNQHIECPHFSYLNHLRVAFLIQPPVFLATIDIKDAYTHIPIRKNLHKFLAFSHNHQLYMFRALPFGLNVAPFIFSLVLSWPLSQLRDKGIQVVGYLDDLLIWHSDPLTLKQQVATTVSMLERLGFIINYKKSSLTPSQEITWLGVNWLGKTGQWQLPKKKQEAIAEMTKTLLLAPVVTRRLWEELLGQLNFATQIHKNLRPYTKLLTPVTLISRAEKRDKLVQLPEVFQIPLQLWTETAIWNPPPYFHSPYPPCHLWTDASMTGWGALLENNQIARGQWEVPESKMHINTLELIAVIRAIEAFNLHHLRLIIHTDNEVIRFAIIKNSVKSKKLLPVLLELNNKCSKQYLHLTALRVPSTNNVVADGLSRTHPLPTEWRLPQEAFRTLSQWAGPFTIDLMATPINTQLPQFISPFSHPKAVATNVLGIEWQNYDQYYMFPPPNMIPKLLPSLSRRKGSGVIVAPWDPQAPWLPALLQLSSQQLHLQTEVFQDTAVGRVRHPLGTSARWTGFRFFANN